MIFVSTLLGVQDLIGHTLGVFNKGRLIPVFLGPESETSSDVPWILRKLNPVQTKGSEEDWQQVIDKVHTFAE